MKKIAAIQMTSTDDVDGNLTKVAQLLEKAASAGASLVVLPEVFPFIGKNSIDKLAIQESIGDGRIQMFLAEQAIEKNIWIVGGTIPISDKGGSNKAYATVLVFNNTGVVVARYDKAHLFDAAITETEIYEESATTLPGKQLTVVDTPVGKLGLAVCYDIRFPELFRELFWRGAEVFAIPTAFTVPTGIAHWEVLVRARAIENLSYVVGACQTGLHPNGRKTYGHSVIVEPWGSVVTQLVEGAGVITADVDLDYLRQRRRELITVHPVERNG